MQRLNHCPILLAVWLSVATTPAMAHDHNRNNPSNACPAGATPVVTYYGGGFVRQSCESQSLAGTAGLATLGTPDVTSQDASLGGFSSSRPALPTPPLSGDLYADAKKAINNCADSSIVSDVEERAKEKGWNIYLEYNDTLKNAWSVASCQAPGLIGRLLGRKPQVTIKINSILTTSSEKDVWPQLAKTLLHEHYHAKDMMDRGCGNAGESDAEARAQEEYKRIFDKPGPGNEDYVKATDGTAPPPCD